MYLPRSYFLKSILVCLSVGLIFASTAGHTNTNPLAFAQSSILRAQEAPAVRTVAVTPIEEVTSSTTNAQSTEQWVDIAPGIQVHSFSNSPQSYIARIDLNNPEIQVQLAHEFTNEAKGEFRRKTIFEFVNDEVSIQRPEVGKGSYYPFVAINATAFTCGEEGLGATSALNAILGINNNPYGKVNDRFGGRCNSFFTYQRAGDDTHGFSLYRPTLEGHAPSTPFPWVACWDPHGNEDFAPTSDQERLDRDAADMYISEQITNNDFTVGYGRTILMNGEYVGGNDELSTRNRNKTAIGIGFDKAGHSRYLFLATWGSAILSNVEEFAEALALAGAHQAILLDGGGSSQFLSIRQNEFVYNNVKEKANCTNEPSGPRQIINSIVAYNRSTVVTRWPAKRVAFVIDDTGSMRDAINDAKETVNQRVNQFVTKGLLHEYHLLTFKDDVNYRGQTNDNREIKSWVNVLAASGGGDCPEEAYGAMRKLAEKAPQSEAWLMSDADPHGTVVDQVKARFALVNAQVKLHNIRYPNTCRTISDTNDQADNDLQTDGSLAAAVQIDADPYAQISAETGGHYFRITSADTQAATSILLNEMVTDADFSVVRDSVSASTSKVYTMAVDATASSTNFLLNTFSGHARLAVFDPSGTLVNSDSISVTYTTLANAEYYQVADPAPGIWRAEIIGEGEYTFSTSGDSAIVLTYFGDNSIAKGETAILLASLTGPVVSATFQLLNLDGSVFETVVMLDNGLHPDRVAGDGLFSGIYMPKVEGGFHLQVQGLISESVSIAADGSAVEEISPSVTTFERVATELIRVQSMNVVAMTSPITANGRSLIYEFTLINGGAQNDTFGLTISSSQGWADTSKVPAVVDIAAGASVKVQIPVNVPLEAMFDLEEETTLVAVSQLNPLVNDADSVHTTTGAPILMVAVNPDGLDDEEATQPGETIVFDIVVENIGRIPMQNATLHTFVPNNTSFNQDKSLGWPTNACSNIEAGAECVLSLGDVEPDAKIEVKFAVDVDPLLPAEVEVLSLITTLAMDNLTRSPIIEETEVGVSVPTGLPDADEPTSEFHLFLPVFKR